MATSSSRFVPGLVLLGASAAVVVLGLWAHMSGDQALTRSATPPPALANGVTVACTDRYTSTWTIGPLENGQQLHYVCQSGRITSWWVDYESGMESAPPG